MYYKNEIKKLLVEDSTIHEEVKEKMCKTKAIMEAGKIIAESMTNQQLIDGLEMNSKIMPRNAIIDMANFVMKEEILKRMDAKRAE